MPLFLFLFAAIAPGEGAAQPACRCQPTVIPTAAETTVSCHATDGVPLVWQWSDGGPTAEGAAVTRVLPAGLTDYAVTCRPRRDEAAPGHTVRIVLDPATLPSPRPPLPPPPDGRDALRVAVIADSNGPYGSVAQGAGVAFAVAALAGPLAPDIVVHNGDLVAGQKRGLPRTTLDAMWDEYGRVVIAPLRERGIPLVPVPGNHDASPSRDLPDRAAYVAAFTRPDRVPAVTFVACEDYPLEYAFLFKGALFLVLDAPTGRLSQRQVAFARRVLTAHESATPRFVFAHVPPFQPTRRAYGTLARFADLAPVLRAGRTDLLVTGHYEVFFPTTMDAVPVVVAPPLAPPCAPRADGQPGCRCRHHTGSDQCLGMGLLLLDATGGRLVRRVAVQGPRFDEVLPRAWLPHTLPTPQGTLSVAEDFL